MYDPPKYPVLPKLVRIGDCDVKTDGERYKNHGVYLLDWRPKERRIRKDYDDKKNWPAPPPFEPFKKTAIFPESFIPYVYSLRFRMSSLYVREVAMQSKKGQEEWSRTFPDDNSRCMDTAIRELCMEPAVTHFKVAFSLLSDCLFDPHDSEKYRQDKFFAKVAMLMYFWDGQTGSGLVTEADNSGGFDRLLKIYLNKRNVNDSKTIEMVKTFVDLVKQKTDDSESEKSESLDQYAARLAKETLGALIDDSKVEAG